MKTQIKSSLNKEQVIKNLTLLIKKWNSLDTLVEQGIVWVSILGLVSTIITGIYLWSQTFGPLPFWEFISLFIFIIISTISLSISYSTYSTKKFIVSLRERIDWLTDTQEEELDEINTYILKSIYYFDTLELFTYRQSQNNLKNEDLKLNLTKYFSKREKEIYSERGRYRLNSSFCTEENISQDKYLSSIIEAQETYISEHIKPILNSESINSFIEEIQEDINTLEKIQQNPLMKKETKELIQKIKDKQLQLKERDSLKYESFEKTKKEFKGLFTTLKNINDITDSLNVLNNTVKDTSTEKLIRERVRA